MHLSPVLYSAAVTQGLLRLVGCGLKVWWTHQRSLCPKQCMEAAVQEHESKGNGYVSGNWSGSMTNNQMVYPNASDTLVLREMLDLSNI